MFNENLFADKLAGLEPYLVDADRYEVRLDANESYFSLPQELRDEFARRMRALDFNRYPDTEADELCRAFAAYYGVRRENVRAGNGSDEIISILMNGFVDKGQAVMTVTPDFSMYAFYASLAELAVVSCPKDAETLQIDFACAERMIRENAVKLCVFSNPCNPTGRIEKKSDIAALAAACPDTLFVIDEAYMDFAGAFSSESFLSDIGAYANIVLLKTMSKAIGAAALRLGFLVADERFCRMFSAVKSPYNVNSVSQSFGTALLERADLLRARTVQVTEAKESLRRELIARQLAAPVPMYTNFVYYTAPDAVAIFEALKASGVLVRCFAAQNALRVTAGTSAENARFLDTLERIMQNLFGSRT